MSFSVVAHSSAENVKKLLKQDLSKGGTILSKALSRQAYYARLDEQEGMREQLDRPKRFSQNAVSYKKSTKVSLKSSVLVNPNNDYLHRMVYGGTRLPQRKRVFVPDRKLRTDASGNMSRARRRRMLGSPKAFMVKSRKGNDVLMLRQGKRLILVGSMERQTRYKGRYWRFHDIAVKSFDKRFDRLFLAEHRKAISK